MGWKRIAVGVPKGSVLGSLLFGLFIRSLPTVLKRCKFTQCADETRIYLHAYPSDLEKTITLIDEDAQAVAALVAKTRLAFVGK